MGVGRVALQILGSSLPIPVAKVLECLLRGTGARAATYQSLKMVLVGLSLALRPTQYSWDWSIQCQDNVTGCGIISSV